MLLVNPIIIISTFQTILNKKDSFINNTPSIYPKREAFFHLRKKTNLSNKGLISADRNNKVTLLLTIPRYNSSRLQKIYSLQYWKIILKKTSDLSLSE